MALDPASTRPAYGEPTARQGWRAHLAAWLGPARGGLALACWLVALACLLRWVLPRVVSQAALLYGLQPLLWTATAAVAGREWVRRRRRGEQTVERRLAFTCFTGGMLQIALCLMAGSLRGFRLSPYLPESNALALRVWAVGTWLVGLEFARWYLVATLGWRRPWLGALAGWLLPWLLQPGPWPATAGPWQGDGLMPEASEGLLATYMVHVGGPWASLAYRGTITAFERLSPILPSLDPQASTLLAGGAFLAGWLVVADRVQQKRRAEMLERQVRQRTVALADANVALQAEVAERLQAEEQLRRRSRQLALLNAAAAAVSSSLESARFAASLGQLLAEELGISAGALYRCREGEEWLALSAAWGLTPALESGLARLPAAPFAAAPAADGERPQRWLDLCEVVPQAGPALARGEPWACAPLRVDGRLWGAICLRGPGLGSPTPDRAALLDALSGQIALAMQNAALYEEVDAGRRRQQALSRLLVQAQEAERRRIARELHDEAAQGLTSLTLGLRLVEQAADGSAAVTARLAQLKQITDRISESLHRLAADLRPASLDHLGLIPALADYARAVQAQHGLQVRFAAPGLEGQRLESEAETALFRIVQEALVNVVRHARATRADVLLARRDGRLIVLVEDDGAGFDPGAAAEGGHLGLLGMRERAEMLGGSLSVESAPGAGATVVVEVPLDDTHPHCR